MKHPTKPTIFLQRASYRQRRLRDAVKFVPFLGVILWLIPLAWSHDDRIGAGALIYVFGVWVVLIGLTASLASRLTVERTTENDDTTDI